LAKKHNRRNFLKVAGSALFLGAAVLWDKMIRSERELASPKTVTIPFDPNREFTFHEKFIVVNKNENLRVFSSYCTHLGCQIHHAENGKLLCPCHGSTFNLEGIPTKGPAIKPLEELAYSVNQTNQTITIDL
jgi:Rieske Fe-S protein